jgi:hypothetical protein
MKQILNLIGRKEALFTQDILFAEKELKKPCRLLGFWC